MIPPLRMALVALLFCAVVAAPLASARSPNIVLIVVDDLGYAEPGCYGGTEIPTPNIDRLAREGVKFTQGYVTAAFCAPSRAALLTGRYQTRFGYEGNPTGALNADPRVGLPLAERTLADRLRAVGYATALVGKWHLGGTAPFHPLRRGFDEFFGFLHEGHYYVPHPWIGMTTWQRRTVLPFGAQGRWTSPDGRLIWTTHMGVREPDYDADNPILRDGQPINETANLTDAFTREACSFIERRAAQPFFLYLAYNAVHSPLQAADHYFNRFSHISDVQRRIFAAQLTHLDDGIGTVLAKLRDTGLERDTLVIFLSDNGGATRELTASNLPLRGDKGSFYEGGIRVPMILRWPVHVPGDRVIDTPVISMDLTVTALNAAGCGITGESFDGTDLKHLFGAESTGDAARTFFWRAGERRALRKGDWKIVRDNRRGQSGAWQLYNLVRDPSEKSDLAAAEPERLAKLAAEWDAWSATQASPRW